MYIGTTNRTSSRRFSFNPRRSDSERLPMMAPFLSTIGSAARFQSRNDCHCRRRRKPVSAVSSSRTDTTDLPLWTLPSLSSGCFRNSTMSLFLLSFICVAINLTKSVWETRHGEPLRRLIKARWTPCEKNSASLPSFSSSSNTHRFLVSSVIPTRSDTGLLRTDASTILAISSRLSESIASLPFANFAKHGLKHVAMTMSEMETMPTYLFFFLSITGMESIFFLLSSLRVSSTVAVIGIAYTSFLSLVRSLALKPSRKVSSFSEMFLLIGLF
mmetsp:Transcript_21556/g.34050  ORF Transcript_21556/g.34050 Transcript_21556/m.34050 type:complete len:272 (-) Transcript_21556:78-893(-)